MAGVEAELLDVLEYGDWCRREIGVAGYGTVTQFHFTEWSSGTLPHDTSGFLQMVRSVKEAHDPGGPICVVCPDGTERSGVFILLYSALCQLECHRSVSLSELLVAMRQSRARMVQSVENYKYCYLCLQELAFGDTSVPLSQFHSFCQKHVSGEGSRLREEFQQLDFVTKNSLRGIGMPRTGKQRQAGSVNASWFDLGCVRNRLLGTQSPQRDTLAAFVQLIWQSRPCQVIMLATQSEYEDIVSCVSHGACYWPEEGLQMEIEEFTVSCLSCETSGALTTQRLALSCQGDTHEFSHLILTDWEESGIPSNYESLATLARQCAQGDPAGPLVVHCGDCVSKSGMFLVGCGAIWQMRHEGKVDVFSLVKQARYTHRDIIATQVSIPGT